MLTIAKLQTMRRLLLGILAVIEAELRERGALTEQRGRTIQQSDHQRR